MRSSTRLDSAVFQLTPTRTRCDLVITANGRTEKIASGLVNPFLAHLKTAQDQMAKGGYSIILELEPGIDSCWFTRGTVERFVRFVSTPEILERVYTLESEILQIEEAIAIQSNNDVGLDMVEDRIVKPPERSEGSKPLLEANEKAIVLYTPGANSTEANGSTAQEENSKVELMKVLEMRKSVLQKEQGMAFARAVAAGFDIDHIPPLLSFALTFGASRLLDACTRFKDLWKRKHETGQWVEIEAEATMPIRLDFSAMNASGIVLSNSSNKQWPATPESNGKTAAASSGDEKSPMDQLPSASSQEYIQGQFGHPMYPPWPIQSPPGTMPVFPGYPMQFPYYPGNGPFFSPPYPSDASQRTGLRRQSMDSGDGNIDPETGEADAELAENQGTERKSSRSSKKKSGKVVIRNINYIISKRHESSGGSESQSDSGSETDEKDPNINSRRSSKKKGVRNDELVLYNEEGANSNEADGRKWEAFQSYLLEGADDAELATNKDMFMMEKQVRAKRRQNGDPLLLEGLDAHESEEGNTTDMLRIGENSTHLKRVSNDDSLVQRRIGRCNDNGSQMDMQFEVDGRRARYRSRNDDDGDFMMHRHENQLAVNGFVHPRKDLGKKAANNVDDDSYVVSLRSNPLDRGGDNSRPLIDMGSEIPASQPESSAKRVGGQIYEPNDFSLIPERNSEKGLVGYDPALDYEAENRVPLDKRNKEAVSGAKQGSKKVDKNVKSRLVSDNKKTVGPIRKGKPSKPSPLEEAKARAEKLRNYKADLQKMKKEKEEQEIKRLEALKIERKKRISSRGGSIPAMPTPQVARKQLPVKFSLSSHKSSKFSDSETGSVSPLQRSKAVKPSATSHSAGNRLSRSVSSLHEPKKHNSSITPDTKASMARIRRLSEPKTSSGNSPVTSVKPREPEPISKPKASSAPEIKKLSAIVNYDKNKIASLPELKIRTANRSDTADGKSVAKELPQIINESQSSTTSKGAGLEKNGEKSSRHSDGDDNPIIEKKVVIQECEKSSIPESNGVIQYQGSSEIAEKPYQAPFARNSSMEDSCTRNTEYGKAPPSSLQKMTGGMETQTLRAHVSDPSIFKLEKIPEVLDKPQAKESLKGGGFRRLLKFGKKNHTSAESDNVSVNDSEADDSSAANIASPSEVNTLKNMISLNGTSSVNNTPQKISRHFSLLSPFRSKTSEKKLST